MKVARAAIRAVSGTLLGALFLAGSFGWFSGWQDSLVQAQSEINLSVTVPTTLAVSVNKTDVNFGTIAASETKDITGAFAITVSTNASTWAVTARTIASDLASSAGTIPVRGNLSLSLDSTNFLGLSVDPVEIMTNVTNSTLPNNTPVALRLAIPSSAAPGTYATKLLIHID